MGTKDNPGEFDCYNLALPDEPLFILRASDASAPHAVEYWAIRYEQRKRAAGEYDGRASRKVREAIRLAEEMRTWRSMRETVAPPRNPVEAETVDIPSAPSVPRDIES